MALALAGLILTVTRVGEARGIRFEHLTIDDGLSLNRVTVIHQDQTGFLWLGTYDGLNRFDGIDFELFENDPDDSASLSGGLIEALAEDQEGNIWIGTRDGGLNRWVRARGKFEVFRHDPTEPNSLASDRVRGLLLDRNGLLWIGTQDAGVDRFDPATGHFTHFRHDPTDPRSLSHDHARALFQDRTGRIWVGTLGGGVSLFESGTETFRRFRHDPSDPSSLSDDSVRAFLEDASGALWVATFGGAARLDLETWEFERFAHDPTEPGSLSDNRVQALLMDRRGGIWLGTDSGLNLLVPETGAFLRYQADKADVGSLAHNWVTALFEDRSGILWVGTGGGGLSRWNPRHRSFNNDSLRASDLASSNVGALTLDAQGRVWIGTIGGGLDVLDRKTGELTSFRHDPNDPRSLSDDSVTALLSDSAGVVWVGTAAGGLSRFDPASGTFTRSRDDRLSSGFVSTIYEDLQGRLWVGSAFGISRLDRATGRVERWLHDPEDRASLSANRVTSYAPAPGGALWVGTLFGGLNRFDPQSGSCIRLRNDPDDLTSLSDDMVFTVQLDLAGSLWVGTRRGLNRLVHFDEAVGKAVFRRYLKRDGLPSDWIYGVLPDDQGNLWLSTNAGLSRFDPVTETFKNFDASHGLQSHEFNQNAFFRAADGELLFGGVNGYNAFYPARITGNTTAPPVVLTGFSKFNQPVELDQPLFDTDEILLDHRDVVVSFEFAALDFTRPEKNLYRYKLEGLNPGWIDLGNRRQVTFTNLDPGSYTLRVQGSNNDGVWNEEGLTLRLLIPPPFWMTWWFRSLALLSIAALLVLSYRVRTRAVIERSQMLERLVDERTRELRTAQQLLLGGTISHFEIVEKLGEGGMGSVWLARDKKLDRTVAIKVLSRERAADPGWRRRLLREARVAAALNHPGIVTIYEVLEEADIECIVMEYIEGKTLSRLIPEGGLAAETAVGWALQIARAVARAHEAGIVHRDLKPGNVMVTASGRVKVLDFGLAKRQQARDSRARTAAGELLTRRGDVLGTPSYMAPEQALGKRADERSDIFSFGAILYEMLSGKPPFRGAAVAAILHAVAYEEPRPLGAEVPALPASLVAAVNRALAKNPAERFHTMEEVVAALQATFSQVPKTR